MRLDRETVVRAAVAVADEGGVAALTMAAVARRLGPYTPMALYRHVGNKDGMVDGMLDAVAGEIALPAGGDWRTQLTAIARSGWEMIGRHPWYADLVHTRPPLGPNALARTERMLEILTGAGAPVAEAMTYAALIDRHVVGSAGQAAEERATQRRQGLATPAELAAAVTTAGADVGATGRYPILASWMAAPSGPSPDQQFALSLAFLLDGIAARLPSG